MRMVVALVAICIRFMNGNVRNHSMAYALGIDPPFKQFPPLARRQFMGERKLDFTAELRISPAFRCFHSVPQFFPDRSPFRSLQWGLYPCVGNSAAPPVAEEDAGSLVHDITS